MNVHSLVDGDGDRQAQLFSEFIRRERPDVVALQEVNQPIGCPGENFIRKLKDIEFHWTWLPVKIGYGKFEEGLAILSLCGEIEQIDVIPLTHSQDPQNWKSRKALGAKIAGHEDWFYSVHMGKWQDADEPFEYQWRQLRANVRGEKTWLMGDFNAPAHIRGEGYDLIRGSGWQDAWLAAGERQGEATIPGDIDGWRGEKTSMRIDYIFSRHPVPIRSARVALHGVSDHFGLLVQE